MGDHQARWILALLVANFARPLAAQIEEGKCAKYLELDPVTGVRDDFPALKIEDLRKLTLYSKLAIRGAQAVIADDKYMRRIEPHPQQKELLLVTSDHFQFTVLKDGNLVAAGVPAESKKALQMLWIKHATRESPDERPWLKDLILLPYDKKTRAFKAPWPFSWPSGASRARDKSSAGFLRFADPRPERAKLPFESQSVVGTFAAGNVDYLVLDVFGGYGWWGKTAALEFIALRGGNAADIDKFHALTKGPPRTIPGQWRNPKLSTPNEILATSPQSLKALEKKLPAVFQTAVRSEKAAGWEDLLLLDEENQPVKALDNLVADAKTFGDLASWASTYLEKRNGGSEPEDWFGPLDEALAEDDKPHVTAARSVRYVFRRMGFPAQILAFFRKEVSTPTVFVHAYVPSQRVSVVFFYGSRDFIAFAAEAPYLYNLPTNPNTFRGKTPASEMYLGGGESRHEMLPE